MRAQHWVDEPFLRAACDVIARELDWDSLHSGCLHRATSQAKTLAGSPLIVGVLGQAEHLAELLREAEQDRRENGFSVDTPLWLYVPASLPLPSSLPPAVVIKRVSATKVRGKGKG